MSQTNQAIKMVQNQTIASNNVSPTIKDAQWLNLSINTLVTTALPLISLMVALKQSKDKLDVVNFRKKLIQEVKNFELKASKLGYSQKIVVAASYCLCVALDEKILNTQCVDVEAWSNQTISSVIYKETRGGEKFYTILNRSLNNLTENICLLELLYLLLSQGFKGKYFDKLDLWHATYEDLFQKIYTFRGHVESQISQNTDIINKSAKRRKIPSWLIACVTAGLLLLFALGTLYQIHRVSKPILQTLEYIE